MENERIIELQLLDVLTEEELVDQDETIRKQKKK